MRVSSVGKRGVTLMDSRGEEHPARAAGRIFSSLPPVPGDIVVAADQGGTLLVEEIRPRRNTLTRADRGGDSKPVAANIDLVVAVMAVAEPAFAPGLLDRILAAAEWDRLSCLVVLNKTDLRRNGDPGLDEYRAAGYRCLELSCAEGLGVSELERTLVDRVVMMAGPSGAGKTSIARCLRPDLQFRVGSVSPRTSRGRHTTTSSRLIPLGHGTLLMDTPGIQGYSVEHIPAGGLGACFPEIAGLADHCRFRDCFHNREPGCAVRDAAENGRISERRYESYIDLLKRAGG